MVHSFPASIGDPAVYALVDIGQSNVSDREVQRILRAVLGQDDGIPHSAVVNSPPKSHSAA